MKIRIVLLALVVVIMTVLPAVGASAHVHGITPLLRLANECGVTNVENTGANRAQSEVIRGLIPRDVGRAGLGVGDGGFSAPVGCGD